MYKIITWHGESATLFYIAREYGADEWEHVITCYSKEEAEAYIDSKEV